MEILLQNLTLIMAVVGVLAFIVSVITQVFKGVGVLAKIPTDILVFVLSIALTVVAYVAYMDYIQQTIIWYMIIAAVLAGFLVAYVAMFGWEKFVELWQRFAKGKKENADEKKEAKNGWRQHFSVIGLKTVVLMISVAFLLLASVADLILLNL